MARTLMVNIHFNNLHSDSISELYLYYKLRWYAKDHGGRIDRFKLTKNELYNIFPRILKRGWVTKNKVNSYRSLCTQAGVTMVWSRITAKDISSINKFKGFIIASAESVSLRYRYGIMRVKNGRRHWDNVAEAPYWLQIKKMSDYQYLGRVYNSHLTKLMRISERTVTRWRKYSKNRYRYSCVSSSYPEILGRGAEQCFRGASGKFITKDLTVHTEVEVFTTKRLKVCK